MSMELSPLEAAKIADAVYSVRKQDALPVSRKKRQAQTGLGKLSRDGGSFDASRSFAGRSGYSDVHTPTVATQTLLVDKGGQTTSNFGFFAMGEGNFADQAIVATRGTAIVADVLTDLWAMPATTAMGSMAHAGFIDTYASYEDELKRFTKEIKGRAATVHCVGHSLGGALATLNAEFLSQRGFDVKLYTFGSPRVGFGSGLSQALRAGNVTAYRAFHDGDPVPMLPCWPFVHTDGACCIGSQTLITKGAHSMTNSYTPGAAAFKNWRAFQRAPDPMAHKDMTFLNSAMATGKSFGAGLLKAVMYALKRLIRTAQVMLGVALVGTVALLDFLAWMLKRAATLAAEFAQSLGRVMGAIMRFLGRAGATAVEMTERFIRFLLEQLFNALSSHAALALAATMAAPAATAMPLTVPFVFMGSF